MLAHARRRADETAIVRFIGEITKILVTGNPIKALVVKINPPGLRDVHLPIWEMPRSAVLFEPKQVWVHVNFNGYRARRCMIRSGPETPWALRAQPQANQVRTVYDTKNQ